MIRRFLSYSQCLAIAIAVSYKKKIIEISLISFHHLQNVFVRSFPFFFFTDCVSCVQSNCDEQTSFQETFCLVLFSIVRLKQKKNEQGETYQSGACVFQCFVSFVFVVRSSFPLRSDPCEKWMFFLLLFFLGCGRQCAMCQKKKMTP